MELPSGTPMFRTQQMLAQSHLHGPSDSTSIGDGVAESFDADDNTMIASQQTNNGINVYSQHQS